MKDRLRGLSLATAIVFLTTAFCLRASGQEWSLQFDGRSGRAVAPHSAELNVLPLTVAAWVKTTQREGAVPILSKARVNIPSGSYRLTLASGRLVGAYAWDTTHAVSVSDSAVLVPDGSWHHVAMVVDTNGMAIFIDGNLRGWQRWMVTAGVLTSTEPLVLGGPNQASTNAFRGIIDEVALWNRTLTQAEIRATLFAPLTGSEPGLVAYWRMNEGAGLVATDRSGSPNNLSLQDGVSWAVSTVPSMPEAPRLLPTVRTLPAGSILPASAFLTGTVNPNYLVSMAWFEWGTNFENRTSVQSFSGNAPVSFDVSLTNLMPGARYLFRLVASNELGVATGSNQFFIPGAVPRVETLPAEEVAAVGNELAATLEGSVNPSWNPTTAWFVWGPDILCRNTTTPVYLGSGFTASRLYFKLNGLRADEVYHYRVVASNLLGVAIGPDQSFTAPGILLNGERVVTLSPGLPWVDPGARVSRPVLAVAAGTYHGLALGYDGRVMSWGDDYRADMPRDLTNIVAIAAGLRSSAARNASGDEFAWGDADFAKLPAEHPPGEVLTVNRDVVAYLNSLGVVHGATNIVVSDGDQYRWVSITEDHRLLGSRPVPPDVADPIAVSAAPDYDYALERDGTLHEWAEGYHAVTDLAPLTTPVFRSGTIPAKPGIYEIHYSATNTWGNAGRETRIVVIAQKDYCCGDSLSDAQRALSDMSHYVSGQAVELLNAAEAEMQNARMMWVYSGSSSRLELSPERAADFYRSLLSAAHMVARMQVPPSQKTNLALAADSLVAFAREVALAKLVESLNSGTAHNSVLDVNRLLDAADSALSMPETVAQYRSVWHHAAELVPRLSAQLVPNGVRLTFAGVPGREFSIAASTNLDFKYEYYWSRVDADGMGVIEIPRSGDQPMQFYRLTIHK